MTPSAVSYRQGGPTAVPSAASWKVRESRDEIMQNAMMAKILNKNKRAMSPSSGPATPSGCT